MKLDVNMYSLLSAVENHIMELGIDIDDEIRELRMIEKNPDYEEMTQEIQERVSEMFLAKTNAEKLSSYLEDSLNPARLLEMFQAGKDCSAVEAKKSYETFNRAYEKVSTDGSN